MKAPHWSTKKAKEIVLRWGNEFNWARCTCMQCQEHDHISPDDQKRLERMIAVALRIVAKI